jgi:enamine deaminase RidA (YjgF/YER057c/UK114 family)
MTAARQQTRHGLEIEEIFGYSQGIRVGNLVYVAGQIGRDESGQPIPEPGLLAKFEKTMSNMRVVLERLASSVEELVYVQLHVTEDLEKCWSDLTELHRRHFAGARPASTVIQVDSLNHPDYLVEISAVAATRKGEEKGDDEVGQNRQEVTMGVPLEAQLGYSQAVKVDKHIYVSGQMSLDPSGNILHEGQPAAQFKQALDNFADVLAELGASLDDVVATHMFLTVFPDEQGFVDICDAHRTAFSENNRPTGTMVYVPKLPIPGAMVEITGVAVMD